MGVLAERSAQIAVSSWGWVGGLRLQRLWLLGWVMCLQLDQASVVLNTSGNRGQRRLERVKVWHTRSSARRHAACSYLHTHTAGHPRRSTIAVHCLIAVEQTCSTHATRCATRAAAGSARHHATHAASPSTACWRPQQQRDQAVISHVSCGARLRWVQATARKATAPHQRGTELGRAACRLAAAGGGVAHRRCRHQRRRTSLLGCQR
jgi:hypothetical protein